MIALYIITADAFCIAHETHAGFTVMPPPAKPAPAVAAASSTAQTTSVK